MNKIILSIQTKAHKAAIPICIIYIYSISHIKKYLIRNQLALMCMLHILVLRHKINVKFSLTWSDVHVSSHTE